MQTEPEQWAVVQEVETVTGDFLTEPGVPFYRIVIDGYCADFDHRQAAENFVAAIQRAFEERERKLREALREIADRDLMEVAFYHTRKWCIPETGSEYESKDPVFKRSAYQNAQDFQAIARQALKETPDAQ